MFIIISIVILVIFSQMVLPNQLWVTFTFENLLLGLPPATNAQRQGSHPMLVLASKDNL